MAAGCAILYAAWAQASLQLLHRFRFPYRDYVFVTEALDKVPALSALAPWKGPSISEHRVIYPNIFYISDLLYFGANGNLLYLSIFAFTALSAMMLIAPVAAQLGTRSSNAPGIAVVFLFAACAVYWFFSEFNWENLTFQIQVCETLCIVSMVLAFLAASRVSAYPRHETAKPGDAASAGVAAFFAHIATFSWGAGLVCWPILLFHAVLYRWRRVPLLIVSLAALVNIALFAYSYLEGRADYAGNDFHQSFASALSRPGALAYFVVNVLAWPPSLAFADVLPLRISRLATIALCALPIALGLFVVAFSYIRRTAAKGRALPSAALFFAMLVAGGVCAAALTGLARSGALVGWGQSRYGVFATFFWLGLVGWFICTSERAALRSVAALTAVTLLMAFAPWDYYERDVRTREQDLYQAGALATLATGAVELPSLYGIANDPEAFAMWKRPRRNMPSFASREPFGWFGRPIASLQASSPRKSCIGEVENTLSVQSNSRVFLVDGWAAGSDGAGSLDWVLVVNQRGIVVGGGKPGLPSYDLAARGTAPGAGSENARFRVVASNEDAEQFSLWGMRANAQPCEIAVHQQRRDRVCEKNCGLGEWYGIGMPQGLDTANPSR